MAASLSAPTFISLEETSSEAELNTGSQLFLALLWKSLLHIRTRHCEASSAVAPDAAVCATLHGLRTMACKRSIIGPREEFLLHERNFSCMTSIHLVGVGQQTHSLVLKSPLLLNSCSLPVNSDAGPLNSCLVLRRRLTSLQGDYVSAFCLKSKQWHRTSPLLHQTK